MVNINDKIPLSFSFIKLILYYFVLYNISQAPLILVLIIKEILFNYIYIPHMIAFLNYKFHIFGIQ